MKIDLTDDFIRIFLDMLQDDDIKKQIIHLINEVSGLNLKDVFFDSIERFQGIIEYDFYLINLIGITKEGHEKQLFIKGIIKGKIKESLFCICDLTYEKYFNDLKEEHTKKLKKITILEQRDIKEINKVSVNLFEENLSKEKVNIEIYFIEISKIIEHSQKKNVKIKERSKYIDLNQKDILVIGVKN